MAGNTFGDMKRAVGFLVNIFKNHLLKILVVASLAVIGDDLVSKGVFQKNLSSLYAAMFKPTTKVDIYASLLKQIPLGSSSASVHACITKQGWQVIEDNTQCCLLASALSYGTNSTMASCISVELGKYRFNSDYKLTNVWATWGFDTNDRMVGILLDLNRKKTNLKPFVSPPYIKGISTEP